MKSVPFYPNHPDDMHCQMSTYASVIDFFLGKKLSWEELEELAGYRGGTTAWTVEALPKMANMGLDIHMIEPVDYARYLKEGEKYLEELYAPEQIKWYREHSNIIEMKKFIPEFLKSIKQESRQASLKDIDDMLQAGRLVFVTVNSMLLNGHAGFASHAILILEKSGDEYIVHDPGLPPRPYRHIKQSDLWAAMGGESNTEEVTGFKLNTTR